MTVRIAFIGQRGVPPTYGGVERYVDEIARRLPSGEVQSAVYCRRHYVQPVQLGYTQQIFVPSLQAKGFEAFGHSGLSAIHAAFARFDLVHFQALGPALFCGLPKLSGAKVVTTIHGIDWQREKWGGVAKSVLKAGDWMMGHVSDGIISVSKNLKHYYEDRYRREVFFVPIGFSAPKTVPAGAAHELYGLTPGKYLLFLNRIVPEKGLHYAIEAFRQIKRDDFKFVIAGANDPNDPYMDSLYSQAAGDQRIVFAGYVDREAVHELYSNAYLFLLPSELEGMPAVILEALSHGCPVLTSDIQESLDVIRLDERQYGFVHKSKDVRSLASQLRSLLENPDQVEAMREPGRSFVNAQYSWEKSVRMTYDVYRYILSR